MRGVGTGIEVEKMTLDEAELWLREHNGMADAGRAGMEVRAERNGFTLVEWGRPARGVLCCGGGVESRRVTFP